VAGKAAVQEEQQNSIKPGCHAHAHAGVNVEPRRTLYSSAAFSNSGAAASQSGFKRKSISEGCQYLLAFFISWSASVIFSPIEEDADAFPDIVIAQLDLCCRVQHVVS
jgi:hypothetical protein